MSHQAFRHALAHFDGNQSRLAAAIGTSQQNISNWLNGGKSLPAEFVLPTERATGISRHELRPDLYPIEEQSSAEAA
jgi:DNA-binding transcriptional regulator YdaS (Cro superfamily)